MCRGKGRWFACSVVTRLRNGQSVEIIVAQGQSRSQLGLKWL